VPDVSNPAERRRKRMKRLQEKRIASSGAVHLAMRPCLPTCLLPNGLSLACHNSLLLLNLLGRSALDFATSLGCGHFNEDYVAVLKGMVRH